MDSMATTVLSQKLKATCNDCILCSQPIIQKKTWVLEFSAIGFVRPSQKKNIFLRFLDRGGMLPDSFEAVCGCVWNGSVKPFCLANMFGILTRLDETT